MNSEGKRRLLTLTDEFLGMNFLSSQFASLGSCDTAALSSPLRPVS